MSKKIKIITYLFTLVIIFFLISVFLIGNEKMRSIKNMIPSNIKFFLKETIFVIPNLKSKNEILKKENNELTDRIEKFNSSYPYLPLNKKIKIKSQNSESIISASFYLLPKKNYKKYGSKPSGYIKKYNDLNILITGKGDFYYIKDDSNYISLNKIENNFLNYMKEKKSNEIFDFNSAAGIRGFDIHNNKIYVSYNNNIKNCYNTQIASSNFNLNYLNFDDFFIYEDCITKKEKTKNKVNEFEIQQSGGAIKVIEGNKILFSIGEYRKRELAQDPDSLFGKIIEIDINNPKIYTSKSMGHRNPQSLEYINDNNNNFIISTEHGPDGGDEININNLLGKENITNFGWPISSYGYHYDRKEREKAPLHKSHTKFGFTEPLLSFGPPSIGISEILNIESQENYVFLIGGMREKSIHVIEIKNNLKDIVNSDHYNFGERIRSITYDNNSKTFWAISDDGPSIIKFNILKNN